MGEYLDTRDYEDHDFNTTTLTINKEHKAEGLNTIEVERDGEEYTTQGVASGLGLFVFHAKKEGTIKFTCLEASATNDVMWALRESGDSFHVSVLDTVAPNLNCNAKKMKIEKPPVIRRMEEHDVIEWTCRAVYLNMKGGSYKIVDAA
jgi:hypothetical protein